MARGRKPVQIDVEAAKEMYESGMSLNEIAEELGNVSMPTVRNRLIEAGVKMRAKGRTKGKLNKATIVREEVQELKESGEINSDDFSSIVEKAKVHRLKSYETEAYDKAVRRHCYVSDGPKHVKCWYLFDHFFKDNNTDEFLYWDQEKEALIYTRLFSGFGLKEKDLESWRDEWMESKKRKRIRERS